MRLSLFFFVLAVSVYWFLNLPQANKETTSKDEKYFSYSYVSARKAFLSRAKALEASKSPWIVSSHVLAINETGRDGEELATDVVWLGGFSYQALNAFSFEPLTDADVCSGSRKPKRVLFHSSGVHGVEGYAGSALQSRILDFFLDSPLELRKDLAVVLIHAVNPYGMSWWRRWNENNVDLNRNFLSDEEWETWATKPNPGYSELASMFSHNPISVTIDFMLCSIKSIVKMGYSGARQALAGGQYSDSRGLFCGGKEVQPGILNIASFLKQHFSEAAHYIAIDVHTGLGAGGGEMLIVDRPEDSWARLQGDHIVSNLYETHGGFPEGLRALFSSPTHVFSGLRDTQEERDARTSSTKTFDKLTQEFGTISGLFVANALYEENFFHQKGEFKKLSALQLMSHTVKKKLLAAFYRYEDHHWKSTILARGKHIFDLNLSVLNSNSYERYQESILEKK